MSNLTADLETQEKAKQQAATDAADKAAEETAFEELFRRYPAYRCTANRALLRDYVGSPVTIAALELAIGMIPDRLAILTPGEAARRVEETADIENVERVWNNRRLQSLSKDELKKEIRINTPLPKPPEILLTRAEILRLHPIAMRNLLHYPNGQARPGVRDEVNRILRGAQ